MIYQEKKKNKQKNYKLVQRPGEEARQSNIENFNNEIQLNVEITY